MPKKKITEVNIEKKKKHKAKKKTLVALVVDRSGSMSSIRQAAFDGINEQLQTLRKNAKKGGETLVTYIQFDDESETVFAGRPAADLTDITFNQYSPRGSTALRDAVWTAIHKLQDSVEETDDTGYLVIVISDGYENASKECSASKLREKMDELRATGKWTFSYMLSNQDIDQFVRETGVDRGNVSSFVSTTAGTSTAFDTMTNSVASYLTIRGSGHTGTRNFYQDTATIDPTWQVTLTTTTPKTK